MLRLLTRPLVPALFAWALLLLAGFYGVHLFLMRWAAGKFKPTAEVPKLMGQRPEKAEAAVRALGLALALDSTSDFSSDVPAGAIQFQFPEAGTRVKPGRRVWVRVSKGPRAVEMPSLRGMSLRQAEITLQQAGLRLGQVRYVRSAAVPAGAALGSHPAPGAVLDKDRPVDVDISSGTEEAALKMPSLLGLSLAQAKKQIEALELKLGKVLQQADKKSLPQTVLSQTPAPGTALNGASVELVVSK